MFAYFLKRLLLFFPTLFGIVLITFTIIQFVPGGPIEQFLSRKLTRASEGSAAPSSFTTKGSDITADQINQLKKIYEFDQPVTVRFFRWCKKLFLFDFGDSYYHHKDVWTLMKEKLPVSMSLGIITFLLTYLICIPLGILKAVRSGSIFDLSTSVLLFVFYSIPSFVLGVFLIVLLGGGSFFDIFPIRGLFSENFSTLSTFGKLKDYCLHLALPITCMTAGSFAILTNLTKNLFLEEIHKQYVTTAKAKGLSSKLILFKHIFRNATIPLVTGFAGSFLMVFFGSSLLIETLFSLDGLGLLSYDSVIKRDYPVVMANLFIFSFLSLVGNLLSDFLYMVLDPRINLNSKVE